MTSLITIAASTTAIIVCGITAIIVTLAFAFRRSRRTQVKALELLDLALGLGKPDQARIQARTEGRSIAPLLHALGGDLGSPKSQPVVKEIISLVLIGLPPLILVGHGLSVLSTSGANEKVPVAATMLLGIGILLPLALAGAIIVIELAERTTRVVRGACITVLAGSVKAAVDLELAESLRRGKDPRGE